MPKPNNGNSFSPTSEERAREFGMALRAVLAQADATVSRDFQRRVARMAETCRINLRLPSAISTHQQQEDPMNTNETAVAEATMKVTLNVQLTADPNQQTSVSTTVPVSVLSKPEDMIDELLRPMIHAISDQRTNVKPFVVPTGGSLDADAD